MNTRSGTHIMTLAIKRFSVLMWCFFLNYSSFTFACQNERPIIQKPIIFNKERIRLTREYQRTHYGIQSQSIKIEPKIIVLHWTGSERFEGSFDIFYPVKLPAERSELPGTLNVSVQFLVDRDGAIYQLMPDNWMGRHVIGLNHAAIGIENVGGQNDSHDLTEEQAESNAYLACYLKKKYPSIHYLIGHQEYERFRNTPLWQEKDSLYRTEKQDPGQDFLDRVRQLMAEDPALLKDEWSKLPSG